MVTISSDSRPSLEELKRRNLPPDAQIGEPSVRTESGPVPEAHPTAEEWLGSALERAQPDVTVTRPRSDRKVLKCERKKKIAAGHKLDDWEDYVGPGMSM